MTTHWCAPPARTLPLKSLSTSWFPISRVSYFLRCGFLFLGFLFSTSWFPILVSYFSVSYSLRRGFLFHEFLFCKLWFPICYFSVSYCASGGFLFHEFPILYRYPVLVSSTISSTQVCCITGSTTVRTVVLSIVPVLIRSGFQFHVHVLFIYYYYQYFLHYCYKSLLVAFELYQW